MENQIELNGYTYVVSGSDTVTVNKENVHDNSNPLQEVVEIAGKQYRLTAIGFIRNCKGISIPSSVTSIGEMSNCSSITIPSSVTSIGEMSYCKNMKIEFPKGITTLNKISGLNGITIPDTVTSIGGLNQCSSITIPSSVTSIGKMWSCSSITIPSSVTSIGEMWSCSSIIIPSSVTSIGNMTYCKDITIPNTITAITYIRCSQIAIPSSVTTISEVDGNEGTTILKMKNMTPPSVGKVTHMSKDDHLIVPQGALQTYKSHPGWGKFKNITEDPSLNEAEGTVQQKTATIPVQGGTDEIAMLKKEIETIKQQLATLEANYKELATKIK